MAEGVGYFLFNLLRGPHTDVTGLSEAIGVGIIGHLAIGLAGGLGWALMQGLREEAVRLDLERALEFRCAQVRPA